MTDSAPSVREPVTAFPAALPDERERLGVQTLPWPLTIWIFLISAITTGVMLLVAGLCNLWRLWRLLK